MRKLVIFILGLVVLLYAAKKYMDGPRAPPAAESSEQKRRLDGVRERTKELEGEGAKRAEEILRGSEGK